MIYTVTFNPSLDYVAGVARFQEGKLNRTIKEEMFPGGKGINVSIVLNNLGIESQALGFIAGFTGREIKARLDVLGIKQDFIELPEGLSRINVKLQNFAGEDTERPGKIEETEINGQGPCIGESALDAFEEKLEKLTEGDYLVLSGSIPNSLPPYIYSKLCALATNKGAKVIVDASRELLKSVLPQRPFLIKPNHVELGELYAAEVKTYEDAALYARRLQEAGARNVLVSMAANGAVLVAEDGNIYRAKAPEGVVRNSVGAGDSMVAGFLYGYLQNGDYEEAFYEGVFAGSATAFSEGLAKAEEIEVIRESYQRL
ncbi:MAG: 1-phosphofructokinase [Lachnospiraceae bacterium]|nr:1-phosphofructokinase [Lachnospiraceae bacterium]